MGHKPSALAVKPYRHRLLDLLRVWHTKAWILDQAEIQQPKEGRDTMGLVKDKLTT